MSGREQRRVVVETVVIVVLGCLGSILVGMMSAGTAVFNWRSPAFQYFSFGTVCAALFAILRERELSMAVLFALPLAAIASIPARKLFVPMFISAVLFLCFAAVTFHLLWKHLSRSLPFGKFVLLALSFVLFELVKTPLVGIAMGSGDIVAPTLINMLLRGTLGIGVGLGVEVGEFVNRSIVQRILK